MDGPPAFAVFPSRDVEDVLAVAEAARAVQSWVRRAPCGGVLL